MSQHTYHIQGQTVFMFARTVRQSCSFHTTALFVSWTYGSQHEVFQILPYDNYLQHFTEHAGNLFMQLIHRIFTPEFTPEGRSLPPMLTALG